jgi:cholesterol transport system auxiliary component
MMRARVRFTWAAAVAATLCLGGCVTLLPKHVAATLYRFGPPAADAGAQMAVMEVTTRFPPGAEGDGILTITGDRAAYIDGARWVAPAVLLFETAARGALVAPDATLAGPAPTRLAIDVLRFETDYDHGRDAAPTVRIEAVFTLTDDLGHPRASRRSLSQRQARENGVGAIVAAYDLAVTDALRDMNRMVSDTASRPTSGVRP